jgi:hypothetical protein
MIDWLFFLADIVDYGGKTFLSDDIAIILIQECREAFRLAYIFPTLYVRLQDSKPTPKSLLKNAGPRSLLKQKC